MLGNLPAVQRWSFHASCSVLLGARGGFYAPCTLDSALFSTHQGCTSCHSRFIPVVTLLAIAPLSGWRSVSESEWCSDLCHDNLASSRASPPCDLQIRSLHAAALCQPASRPCVSWPGALPDLPLSPAAHPIPRHGVGSLVGGWRGNNRIDNCRGRALGLSPCPAPLPPWTFPESIQPQFSPLLP